MSTKSTLCGALIFAPFCLGLACQPPLSEDEAARTDDPGSYEIQSARIPRITAVNPPMASNIGGTYLNITGKSFAPGAQVYLGSELASSTNFISSTQLAVVAPQKSLPVGPIAVQVVNPDGRQSARSDVLSLFNDNVALVPLRGSTQLLGQRFYASADFNADGVQDFLVGDGYGRLNVLIGHGRGDYSDVRALSYISGGSYFRIDAGDANGDGKPDIIIAGSGSTGTAAFTVFLNTGDGNFSGPVQSTPSLSISYSNSYLADVNGDGKTDVIVNGNSVSPIYGLFVFFGTSDGRYTTSVNTGLSTFLLDAHFGDVNGDGKLDMVAIPSAMSALHFLAGSGDGRFAPPTTIALDGPPRDFVLGDLNGDGKIDLASLAPGGPLSLRIGRGDGTFSGTSYIGMDPLAETIDRGDVNGDGKLDLVIGRGETSGSMAPVYGSAWLLAGNGDGTLQAARVINLSPLLGASTVKLLDADKDGRLDVLAANQYDSTLAVIYGKSGGFIEDVQLPSGATALAQGDLNGDGKSDLVAVSVGANKLYVLTNNGDSTLAAPRAYDTDRGPSAVVIADVTGDGKPDLLVSNYDAATVSLLPGNGDGTFSPQRTFVVGAGANALIAQDMNGDGKLDIVTANYEANSVSVLLNSGSGTFATAKNYSTGSGSGPVALGAGDLNGDGKIDVVTANADSSTISYLQGSAASAGALNAQKSTATGKGPNTLTVRDWNGDGKLDVVTGNSDSADVSLLAGKGDGTFTAASALANSGYVLDLAAADFSGDGRLDFLTSGSGTWGGLTLFYGFAGGIFAPSSRTLQATGALAALDANGDGRLDLFVGQSSGKVQLFINTVR